MAKKAVKKHGEKRVQVDRGWTKRGNKEAKQTIKKGKC